MSAPEIRVLDDEAELIAATNVFRAAMVGFPKLVDLPAGTITKLLEPGRTLGAFVDGVLVGTTDSAASTLILPGGNQVPHAAVTHVGVLPTATRRGVATALMHHQLRDLRNRGEVVATLRASEATIYERFGYSVASSTHTLEVRTAEAVLRRGVGEGGPVRLVEPGSAWDLLPAIYSRARPTRPGGIGRPAVWWQNQQFRAATSSAPSYVAVHGEPGAEDGFVRYRPENTDRWFVQNERTVVVDDFFAPTDSAYLGLVRYLLDLDLVDRLVFTLSPVDDPLPWLLTDRRAVQVVGERDETWLRVLDTHRALAGRRYADATELVIAVQDRVLPDNAGTFALTARGVVPTSRPPQLTVDVATLAAVLLGGTSWRTAALAGLVAVADPEALEVADRLFAVPLAPFAGFYF